MAERNTPDFCSTCVKEVSVFQAAPGCPTWSWPREPPTEGYQTRLLQTLLNASTAKSTGGFPKPRASQLGPQDPLRQLHCINELMSLTFNALMVSQKPLTLS